MSAIPDSIDEQSGKDVLMQLPERPWHVIMEADKMTLNHRVYTRECLQRAVDKIQGKPLLVVRQSSGLATEARPEDIVGLANEFMLDVSGNLLADIKLTHYDWIELVKAGANVSFTTSGIGMVDIVTGVVSEYTLDGVVSVVKP